MSMDSFADMITPDDIPEGTIPTDLNAPMDPEALATEAREQSTVADILSGGKMRSTKVLIFGDLELVDTYVSLNGRAQALADAAGNIDLAEEGGPERNAALVASYNELEPQVEAAKAAMLEKALSFHMVSYPNIALKVAKKEARKRFANQISGIVTPELKAEMDEWTDLFLLGASIAKVVNYKGEAVDFGKPRAEMGQFLSETLHPSQWNELYGKWLQLALTNAISQAGIDPGF